MAAIDEIEAAGLFDAGFYASRYPDVCSTEVNPVGHFCEFGWREGRDPNSWFDTVWYLGRYRDVRRYDLNPLLHYIRHGEAEGRRPHPHFDPVWYARINELGGAAPLAHFLRHRLDPGVFPSPELYAVPFLGPYRDDPAAGTDPYLHYLTDARGEATPASPDARAISPSGIFDANHYLINGSDVHQQGLDPIEHFCRYGWREGRKPCLYFDTAWYLASNKEVGRLGINPLSHYILEGERAGRRPVVFFDPAWYRAAYDIPANESALGHYLAHRRSQRFSPCPHFDLAWYLERTGLGPNRDPFAHFLRAGTFGNADPSPYFDSEAYRKRVKGRPSRLFKGLLLNPGHDNPLVHWLHATYGTGQEPRGTGAEPVPADAPSWFRR